MGIVLFLILSLVPSKRKKCVLQTLLSSARPRLESIWPCKQGVEVCPDPLCEHPQVGAEFSVCLTVSSRAERRHRKSKRGTEVLENRTKARNESCEASTPPFL